MIELDPSLLPPEMTYVVMLRGAQIPPLVWTERRQDTAKQHLEDNDNNKLFGRVMSANEEMACAVRAMLYLWNGWIQECAATARSTAEKERHYLTGLCYRHASNVMAAKASFQSLDGHPTFEVLAHRAVDQISISGAWRHKTIGRFKQIMEFDPIWEPFAFVDIVEAARAGKFDRTEEDLVRTLQCLEWEILFKHCYEAAVGEVMARPVHTQHDAIARRKIRERKLKEKKRREQEYKLDELQREKSKADSKSSPARGTPSPKPSGSKRSPILPPPPPNTIPVACPACGHLQRVTEAARGKAVKCCKCQRLYSIPKPSGASA